MPESPPGTPPDSSALPDDPTRRAALLAAIDQLYADLGAGVSATGVQCLLSGNCCDFEKVDHTLFATAAEVERAREYLLESADRTDAARQLADALCPFWVNRACTARDVRPLGCRVYFCDPAYEAEHASPLYERFHARLRALLAEYDVPYAYVPFVTAVRIALPSSS